MTPETQKLIKLLESHLGYSEGKGAYTKFGDWYGRTVEFDADYSGAPWCDMFLSWAAHKLGYEEWVGQFAYTVAHAEWFKKNDAWGHKPKPGALVFYDWGGSNDIDNIDHVGIVTKVVGDTIFTIEGNIDGGVAKRKERDQSKVAGYGYPEKIKERLEAARLKEAEVEGSLPPDTEQGQADRLQLPAPAETTVTSLIPSRIPSAEPSSPTMAAGAEDAATPKAATVPKSTSPSPSASTPRSPATTATDRPVAKKAKHAKPATADTEAATREPVTAFKDASASTPVPALGSPALIGPVLLAALGVLAVARTRQLRVRLSPAAAAATASTPRSASAPGSASASRPAVASASARPSRQPGRRRASGPRRGRPVSARPAEHPATSPLTATAVTISAPVALPDPVTTTEPTLAFAVTAADHAIASTASEASAATTAAASTTASEAVGAFDASLTSEAVSSLETPTTSEVVSSLETPTTSEATAFDVMAATGTRAGSGSGHASVRASALASDPAAALAAGLETSSAILAQLEAFSSAPFDAFSSAQLDAFSSAPFDAFAEATAPSGDGYRGRRRRREHLTEESAAFASDAPIRGRRHRSQAPALTRGQDTRAHRATSTGSPARLSRPARPSRPTRPVRPEQPARGTTTAPHADVLVHSARTTDTLVHSAVTGPHADTLVHSGAPRASALPRDTATGRQRDSLVTGPHADRLVHSGATDGFGRGATDTFSAAVPLRGRRHRDSAEYRDAAPAPHPFPAPEAVTPPPARVLSLQAPPDQVQAHVPAAFTQPAQTPQVQSGRRQEPALVGASGGSGGRSGRGRGGRHRA
ncbi:CHAP domain-containing protein [Nonomuraea dietziae]|uniref:CHAP domain-containing protein n=1 Tax=Nonomuraea dietziae TaxID=65515 RepID=UPI0034154B7F